MINSFSLKDGIFIVLLLVAIVVTIFQNVALSHQKSDMDTAMQKLESFSAEIQQLKQVLQAQPAQPTPAPQSES